MYQVYQRFRVCYVAMLLSLYHAYVRHSTMRKPSLRFTALMVLSAADKKCRRTSHIFLQMYQMQQAVENILSVLRYPTDIGATKHECEPFYEGQRALTKHRAPLIYRGGRSNGRFLSHTEVPEGGVSAHWCKWSHPPGQGLSTWQ